MRTSQPTGAATELDREARGPSSGGRTRRWTTRAVAVCAAGLAVVLVSCSSTSSSGSAVTGGNGTQATTSSTGAQTSTPGSLPGKTTELKVSLTSKDKRLHTVGTDKQITYGWNLLTGSTTVAGTPTDVELLGSVDYVSGNGPWSGFITLTQGTDELGFRVTKANATLDPATKNTAFTGALEVVGGTGRFANAQGGATVTGQRLDALGGQVDLDITMTLTGVA